MTTEASSTITTSVVHSPPLDTESPFYLHSSDSTSAKLVGDVLTGIDDYNSWALVITMALKGRNKFGFVDGNLHMPDTNHPDYA